MGRISSVLLVLALALSIFGTALWLGMTQLADVVTRAPNYQENLHRKIELMRNPAGSALNKVMASFEQLQGEITEDRVKPIYAKAAPGKAVKVVQGRHDPIEVEVVAPRPGLSGPLSYVGLSLARLVGVAMAVIVFALFMLIQRGDLRNRFIHLVGTGHLNILTTALDDAAHGVSRYLFTQSLVNAGFGFSLGLGLFWVGVPNAPFWGVLGATLRFVPYVGTLMAGFAPLLLTLAVFDGWTRPLYTLGLFAGIEITLSAAIEPWLYGAHTGISSLAILLSAAFWTLLWGPIGLILSTPLTVCLLVLGRYVPSLQFLRVLLGEKVELPIEACYYQRLLAMDDEEAQEIVENYLKDRSLGELFDLVLVPALGLAEQDRHKNALDEEREKFIYQCNKVLIEDLGELTPKVATLAKPSLPLRIACLPARDEADEIVGLMLEQVLRLGGYELKAVALGSRSEMLQAVQEHQAEVLFISALPPFALMQARSLCRKARRRSPGLKIILGLWNSPLELERLQERVGLDCFDSVITNLRQAEFQLSGDSQSDWRLKPRADSL